MPRVRKWRRARSALDGYEAGKGDFADYLVREHARAADCESVATFDRVLVKERGVVAPK